MELHETPSSPNNASRTRDRRSDLVSSHSQRHPHPTSQPCPPTRCVAQSLLTASNHAQPLSIPTSTLSYCSVSPYRETWNNFRERSEMNLSSRVGVDRLGRHSGNNSGSISGSGSVSSASPGETTPSRAQPWLPTGIGSSGGSEGSSG